MKLMSESDTQPLFALQRAAIEQQRRMFTEAVTRQAELARVAADSLEVGEAAADASIEMGRLATQTPLVLAEASTLDGDMAEARAEVDERFDDLQVARADAFEDLEDSYDEAVDAFDESAAEYTELIDRQTEAMLDAQDSAASLVGLTAEGLQESSTALREQFSEMRRHFRSQVRQMQTQFLEGMELSRRQFARQLEAAEEAPDPIEVAVEQEPPARTGDVETPPAEPASPEEGQSTERPEEEEAMD